MCVCCSEPQCLGPTDQAVPVPGRVHSHVVCAGIRLTARSSAAVLRLAAAPRSCTAQRLLVNRRTFSTFIQSQPSAC